MVNTSSMVPLTNNN